MKARTQGRFAVPRRRLDPRREIVVDVVIDGPAKGWIHTHGLAARGLPELELRGVPLFLRDAAAGLLDDVAGYLLNDATRPLLPGQSIGCGARSVQVIEGRPDPEAGYDPEHYSGCTRLTLIDPPEGACRCEACERELAERGRPH